ncbi:MAG TPA: 4-hydroxy-3-methylbut-2-enyl diphosphate reductase [Phycisphaerae bacterium]|nr:4-hydroxy-3-methylbut-2-enyl diphosphate reductase [Phycisphaerae bacterium]
MRIVLAEAMGMCFGVRDALAAMRGVERPVAVTVMGELVHNPAVNREVAGRGFRVMASAEGPLPATAEALITAHGISDAVRGRLAGAGIRTIDTTCPLVRRAHAAAQRLVGEGRFLIVLGKRGHVEVQGLIGDVSPEGCAVVEHGGEVRRWPEGRLGVIAQTTFVEREAREIVERIRELNCGADVAFVNTICAPTRERQTALARLVEQIDVLVVVGGRRSNNTRQLVQAGISAGVRVLHIESATELRTEAFVAEDVVGVTAGTSTLDETVGEVVSVLRSFCGNGVDGERAVLKASAKAVRLAESSEDVRRGDAEGTAGAESNSNDGLKRREIVM